MIYNRYKGIGIPDFVLSPFLNIEDDSEVIKKITDREYLDFLSPYVISKVVNSEYLTDDDVNKLAEYFINTDRIRVTLRPQNYLNFVYNVTDVRIIDYVLKDSFIVEYIGVLMAKLPKIKKAHYVALKIKIMLSVILSDDLNLIKRLTKSSLPARQFSKPLQISITLTQ
ncbi:hypothetical protein CCP3SC1AL1_1390001 [Gammaproteobacteria bacterium]